MLQFAYMLPIILSLGPVKIYSYGLFFAIGLYVALYFWWKMGRDEHLDEIALFDAFFLSLFAYFLVGRVAYVLMNFETMGTLYRSLALLSFPGIEPKIGLAGSMVTLLLFSRNQDWDSWKIFDAWVVALAPCLFFVGIGTLLNNANSLWLSNTIFIVWALSSFLIVAHVRKNFRFYSWYRGDASMVKEGLAALFFLILVGIYFLSLKMWILGCLGIVGGGYMIYRRVEKKDIKWFGQLKNKLRRKK